MTVAELEPISGDVAGRPLEWLEAEIYTLAGHIAAATCRFLLLIGELDRRAGWARWECRSCAHWLSWKCGMSLRTARDHVRVARALEHLPVMTEAFAAGQLSYSKVRAMTRVATPKTEQDLVSVAMHATASHIDRIVGGYRTVERNMDPDRAQRLFNERGIWFDTRDDGTGTVTIHGGPEAIAFFKQAVDAALPQVPQPIDEPKASHAARRFDALEHILDVFLEPDEHKAPSTETVIHVDIETLTEDLPGRCELEDGTGITGAVLQRLTCDSGIRLAHDREGQTLDIGRRSRSIPPALRRSIIERDRGMCRFPGCSHRGRLQIHHRKHWSRKGHTKKTNLILVCLYHHKVLHEGGWNVTGDANGALTFTDPNGRPMAEVSLPPPRTDAMAIRREHVAAGTHITADTIIPRWAGDPLDLHHAVDSLWHLDPPTYN